MLKVKLIHTENFRDVESEADSYSKFRDVESEADSYSKYLYGQVQVKVK
jgi:hypothetical protein